MSSSEQETDTDEVWIAVQPWNETTVLHERIPLRHQQKNSSEPLLSLTTMKQRALSLYRNAWETQDENPEETNQPQESDLQHYQWRITYTHNDKLIVVRTQEQLQLALSTHKNKKKNNNHHDDDDKMTNELIFQVSIQPIQSEKKPPDNSTQPSSSTVSQPPSVVSVKATPTPAHKPSLIDRMPIIPPRTFQPYHNSILETPMIPCLWNLGRNNDTTHIPNRRSAFHYILTSVGRTLFHIRWYLSHPLKQLLFPRVLRHALVPNMPLGTIWLISLTLGDVLLFLPLIVLFLLGYQATYWEPSVDQSGKMAVYALYLTVLTANKSNSIFSLLLGIPFERMIPLHYLSSLLALVLVSFHFQMAYQYGSGRKDQDSIHVQFGTDPHVLWYALDGPTALSGTISAMAMFVMIVTSFYPILRRWYFQAWYTSHVLLGMTSLVALIVHNVDTVYYILAWWGLDLVVRYAVMASVRYQRTAILTFVGNKGTHEPALRLQFPKGCMDYMAGQFVQIGVPQLSFLQFHPITISSAPHEEFVTLHIRALGDWTQQLVQLVMDNDRKVEEAETTPSSSQKEEDWKTRTSTTTKDSPVPDKLSNDDNAKTTAPGTRKKKAEMQLTVCIEGPYGSLAVNIEDDTRYRMAIFITGGIGVTPCQSIGKSLLHEHYTQGRNLKYLHYVWAVRDLGMVHDIVPLDGQDYSERNPTYLKYMADRNQRHLEDGDMQSTVHSQQSSTPVSDASGNLAPDSTTSRESATSRRRPRRRRPALIQTDVYLTRTPSPDAEQPPTNELPYNLKQGRPDLDEIFLLARERAREMGETNVAVFGCGPLPLMNGVQEACRQHSASVIGCQDNAIFFDFHREQFDL